MRTSKTKAQLLEDLAALQKRVAELETARVGQPLLEIFSRQLTGHKFDYLENISDGFFALDSQLAVIYFNKAAERLLGRKREEVLGQKLFESFPEAKGSIFEEKYTWALQQHEFVEFETYFGIIPYENWYNVRVHPLDNGITVYFQVITERKHIEQALRDSGEQFRSTFEQAAVGIAHVDPDGKFLRVNQRFCDIVGYTKEEIVQRTFQAITYPADLSDNVKNMQHLLAGQLQTYSVEKRYIRKDNSVIWCNLTVSLSRNSTDNPGYFISVIEDISSRKKIENALYRERDLTIRITETSPVGIVMVNRRGQIIFANVEAEKILGLSKNEIMQREYNAPGWRITDFRGSPFPEEDLPFRRVLSSGQPVYGVRHAIEWSDGRRVLLSINAAPFFDEMGQVDGIVASLENITMRVRAEEIIQSREEWFHNIVDQSLDGIRLMDQDGMVIEWNHAAEEITGLKREDVLGLLGWDVLFRLVVEENRTSDVYENIKSAILESLRENPFLDHKGIMNERPIQAADGTRKWLQTTSFLVKMDSGPMLCAIMRDITEYRRIEEHRLKLALEQEKVKIISDLIRDVSHEFRTPLSVIYAGLGIIEYSKGLDERAVEWIKRIKSQTTYIHELVEAMIVMSRLDSDAELSHHIYDVNTIVQYVATAFSSRAHEKNQTLVCELASSRLLVYVDESSLHQALKNICLNAIEFTPAGGTVTLRTYRRAEHVIAEIQDNGPGINAEDLPHLFDRFFRADKARTDRHAGLGLSIAQKIIELHQGQIEVESTPEQGSTFRVVLHAHPE